MTKRVGALGNCSLLSRVSGTNPIFIKIASRGLCKLFIQRLIFHQQLNIICLIKYWPDSFKESNICCESSLLWDVWFSSSRFGSECKCSKVEHFVHGKCFSDYWYTEYIDTCTCIFDFLSYTKSQILPDV